MSLSPAQLQAIKVLANDKLIKESRDSIEPGVHSVDFTLRVSGAVKVGKDTETSPTAKLDDKTIIALLLGRLADLGNATTVADCVESANALSAAAKKKLVAATDYAETLAAEKERVLREKGKTPKRGAVTGTLSFTLDGESAPEASEKSSEPTLLLEI